MDSKKLVHQSYEISQIIKKVWGVEINPVVDEHSSNWHNACDNYQREYPGQYQDWLESIKE